MHQEDASIIIRSNVQSDVVVVNQCDRNNIDEFDFINNNGRTCHAKFICTTERGLSRSRNMAIRNAWADICQICDDDEVLEDDCEQKVLEAYHANPNAGVIAFALIRKDCGKKYPEGKKSLGFKQILKTSSLQITFKSNLMGKYGICFDEKMGSGTGNGGGEENKFLLDCKRNGIKLLYVPVYIATVNKGESQWFNGYTEKYATNIGWTSRRTLGCFIGYAYIWYFSIRHRKHFAIDGVSLGDLIKCMHKGFMEKR